MVSTIFILLKILKFVIEAKSNIIKSEINPNKKLYTIIIL